VRDGRIAGGACSGYRLERKSDGSGRKYTIAVVSDGEARIVRRIYEACLGGRGLKQIAHHLRAEQKRLSKAVALSDDVPELVVELQQRSARIQGSKRCRRSQRPAAQMRKCGEGCGRSLSWVDRVGAMDLGDHRT
jgi:hypothetical protein